MYRDLVRCWHRILSNTAKPTERSSRVRSLKKFPVWGQRLSNSRPAFYASAERYPVVEQMARDKKCKVADLIGRETLKSELELTKYVTDEVGLPTLNDILTELAKPGRDPRSAIKVFEFADGIYSLSDLQPGMVLPGIVTNITRFGAFVDVGVKQDGLVHISEIADRFISDPSEVVKLHQHVRVKVLEVDMPRKRIAFSIKQAQ